MSCKIDTVIAKYDLDQPNPRYDTIDNYLLTRWTGTDGREADGYRPLTDWFNKRLLKRIYDVHNRETIGTRIDSEYAALTDDATLMRQEVIDDLAQDGIDIEAIRSDMVSWSTMRHHLNDCLDGKKDTSAGDSGWEKRSVEIAHDQAVAKTEKALRSLTSKGVLPSGESAEIDITIQLSCPHCPVRIPFEDAIKRGYVCDEHLSSDTDAG